MAERQRMLAVTWAVLAGLAVLPLLGDPFTVRLVTRIMIYGLAALSLDLILGFAGLVSFGHAAYFGLGAYVVGIGAFHGATDALLIWPVALIMPGLVGLVVGAISLRTSGVSFIMITLAFAQMLFFLAVSLRQYGADDGMSIWSRNRIAGNTIRRKVVHAPAPSVAAASSSAGSNSWRTGCTLRTTSGSVTTQSASRIPTGVKTTCSPIASSALPIAPLGPYRVAIISPVTSVGIASGTSTSDERMFRPGKRKRTRTHARATPITPFRVAASAEVIRVSHIACHALGIAIAWRNEPRPSPKPRVTTAPTGITTNALR
jgi:hypothetical protein